MKVQTVVAWAISELAAHHPKCQDHFAQNNAIRLLVSHLAFETIQEHSKYAIANKQKMSIHSVVIASNTAGSNDNNKAHEEDDKQIAHPMGNQTPKPMYNVVTNTMTHQQQWHGDNAKGNHNNAKKQQL